MLLLGIIHIFCACVVVGYLVYDVAVFSAFRKRRNEAEFKALKREILAPSAIVLGVAFAGLLASGFALACFYMDTSGGIWRGFLALIKSGFAGIITHFTQGDALTFQAKLTLKLLAISLLFVFTPISFFYILVLKKPDPMRRFYHHLALIICLIALILARMLLR